ncbi:MAG: helix-turn-helix domain-containing protein [Nitrososphaera sp.]
MIVTLLNYKFRIYPTKEQELVLEQTLDGCRWVYNYFLSIPKMSEYDMNYALTELKEQHILGFIITIARCSRW